MTRLMTILAATSGLAGAAAAIPAPAQAQAGERRLIIYGNDACPRDAICIVRPEKERYRLPQSQNPQGTRQQRESWAQRSKQLMTVGNTGGGTCSPVGPTGYTGCLVQEINQAKQDSREQQQQDTAPER